MILRVGDARPPPGYVPGMALDVRFVVQCFVRAADGSLKKGPRIELTSRPDAVAFAERVVPTVAGAVLAQAGFSWGRADSIDVIGRYGELPDDDVVNVTLLG